MSQCRHERALRRLVKKLQEISEDESYLGIFLMLHELGVDYEGPDWVVELMMAEEALRND